MPDPHEPGKTRTPNMLTTDLALRIDPEYEKISRRFHENPDEFADAFARAWFKLTHRDMGPKARYLGPEVPAEDLIWQDPLPRAEGPPLDATDVAGLKEKILASGLSVQRAGLYRLVLGLDLPRLGPARRRQWRAHPAGPAEGLGGQPARAAGEGAGRAGRHQGGLRQRVGKKVSMADLIVLGGTAAVEKAAADGGHPVEVPFTPGRVDATQDQTDVESFEPLEPHADAFRNYVHAAITVPTERIMVDRAQLLGLSAPEMTVLVGGMRAIGANYGDQPHGVFTDRKGALTNDFFVNLLDMGAGLEAVRGRRARLRRP